MKHAYLLFVCLSMPTLVYAADDTTTLTPLFEDYCIQCHGPKKQKGDIRFDDLSTFDPALWEIVYEQLASEEMPPDDEPQPSKEQRHLLTQHTLARATQASQTQTAGLRRLNKREYANTVVDLLGLQPGVFDPGEYIYQDDVAEGFDTQAKALVISNELLLEYMESAEKSLRHALFTDDIKRPTSRVIDVRLDKMQGTSNYYATYQKDHVVFRAGGKYMAYDGEATRTITTPGRYRITITASAVDRQRYPERFKPAEGPLILGLGILADESVSVSGDGKIQQTFNLKDDAPQTFQLDTWIDKGHFPYLYFVNGTNKPITQIRSGIRRGTLKPSAIDEPYVGPGIQITQYKIEGPFHDTWPPQSIRTTYDADKIPDLANPIARQQLILRFATRAFRRHVTPEETAPYLNFLNTQYDASGNWRDAIIKTFTAMMSSPDFLYLHEDIGELDAFSLANRLSYFFWSTMPDDELFALAKSGKLKDDSILLQQVERLINDPKSARLSTSFVSQWLALNTLGTMRPDGRVKEFRAYFQDNLEPAMLEETQRYFHHVLLNNRSVSDFIDSNYSFLNKALATHYDVPFEGGQYDPHVRVTFPPHVKRGGILGHSSILTLTANGVETSPVVRGVWVLANFLGTPPPPPPKEVPALTPDLNGSKTVRDLLEKHRTDPACLECHRKIDPLGFALEAYDPIGRFRPDYSKGVPVDTRGNFAGQNFDDIAELKKILLSELRPFARNLTMRMAEYAMGRKPGPSDYAQVDQIVTESASDHFALKNIIVRMATSDLMRMK